MAALISWVCRASHPALDRIEYVPMVTVNEGAWAFCLQGGDGQHDWVSIVPCPIERLRFFRPATAQAPALALEH